MISLSLTSMQATLWPKAGGSCSWTRDCSRFNNCKKFVHCQVRANETYSEAKSQFVTGTGMFLSIPSPLINCGQLLSLRCSARVRLCLCLLVRVVNWWALTHCVRFLFSRLLAPMSHARPPPPVHWPMPM